MFGAHAQQDIGGNKPITEFDIEQRSKLKQLSPGNAPSRAQVIDELRNEKLKVQEARKFGVTVSGL